MNTLLTRAITAFLVAALCLCHSPDLLAQDAAYKPKDQKLYDTIEQLDAALFDAFNRQDLESLMKFFSEDIEFFDDGEGLTNYKQNLESFKGLFARNKTSSLRRELVKDSLEVYAVPIMVRSRQAHTVSFTQRTARRRLEFSSLSTSGI